MILQDIQLTNWVWEEKQKEKIRAAIKAKIEARLQRDAAESGLDDEETDEGDEEEEEEEPSPSPMSDGVANSQMDTPEGSSAHTNLPHNNKSGGKKRGKRGYLGSNPSSKWTSSSHMTSPSFNAGQDITSQRSKRSAARTMIGDSDDDEAVESGGSPNGSPGFQHLNPAFAQPYSTVSDNSVEISNSLNPHHSQGPDAKSRSNKKKVSHLEC